MRRLLSLLLAVGMVVGCADEPDTGGVAATPGYPALWEITGADGASEGWLFGTIHALPDGVVWRSPRLEQVVAEADMLVVEVGELGDGAAIAQMFAEMASDREAAPVAQRIDPALRDEFDELVVRAKVGSDQFDALESWAAALALAQAARTGKAENGADRAILNAFADREIVELEGARAQLAIFDGLPEAEQRDLLDAVIAEAAASAGEPDRLARLWKRGDLAALEAVSREGMLGDPELRAALLTDRNRRWAAQIENLLSAPQRPLVAVGAGHLVGPEGLPALLEARGYRVRRID